MLCVFGVLSEEKAPSSVIVPSPGERGPSSAFSPDPESSPKCLSWDSSQIVAKRPPQKIAWLRADGMLDTACSNAAASRREERLLLKRVLLWQRGGGWRRWG